MVLKNNSECTGTSYTAEAGWEAVGYLAVPFLLGLKGTIGPSREQRSRDQDSGN